MNLIFIFSNLPRNKDINIKIKTVLEEKANNMPTIFSKFSKTKKIVFTVLVVATIVSLSIIAFIKGGSNLMMLGLIVIAVTVGGGAFYLKVYQPQTRKNAPRRGWTEQEKQEVRLRQGGVCNKCGLPPPRWEYHHRDGNRSNNSLSNCEGLCPNCHSVKTHDG